MRKGFTLVELIVVLVILAVLAAMLIPSLVGYIEKSLEASDILDVRMAYIDVMTAVTEGGYRQYGQNGQAEAETG